MCELGEVDELDELEKFSDLNIIEYNMSNFKVNKLDLDSVQ